MSNSLTTTMGFGIAVQFEEDAWSELPEQYYEQHPDFDADHDSWSFVKQTIQEFNASHEDYPDICYGSAGTSNYQTIFYLALKSSIQSAYWEILRFNPDEMYAQIDPANEDEVKHLQQLAMQLGLTEEQCGYPGWFCLSDYS